MLRQYYFPIYLAYVLLSGFLISLALLCYGEGRTPSFWIGLGVMEGILLAAFGVVQVMAMSAEPDKFSYRSGGPAAGLIKTALYYVVATAALMAGGAVADRMGFGHYANYLKLLQPLLSVVVALYAGWLQWTRASKESAEDDLASQGDGPRNLAALIRSTERRVTRTKATQSLLLHLSALREDLQFRLPVGGKVLVHPRYRELVVKIRRLMNEMTSDPDEKSCAVWIQKLEDYRTEAERVRMEVRS